MRTHRPASAPLRIVTTAAAARGRQLRCFAGAALLFGGPALAQIGGAYDLSRNTVDAGGATFSTGGVYAIGGTIGQPDAGTLSGGAYDLHGGFWSRQLAPVPTPKATHTETLALTPSRTPTLPLTLPPTKTPSRTPTRATSAPSPTTTSTATATITRTGTRLATAPATATPTPSGTPSLACAGDCNRDAEVTVNELLIMVNIALGTANVSACTAGDANDNGAITINEIIIAVNVALTGCAGTAQACGGIAGLPCGTGEVCDLRDPTCSVADLMGTCVPGPLPCLLIVAPVCGDTRPRALLHGQCSA